MKRLYRSVVMVDGICANCGSLKGKYQFIEKSGDLDYIFCADCVPKPENVLKKNGCYEIDLDNYICEKSYPVIGRRLYQN